MNIEIKVKESAELVLGLQNYMFCFELQNALYISKIQTLAYFNFFICTYYRENFVTFGDPSIMRIENSFMFLTQTPQKTQRPCG